HLVQGVGHLRRRYIDLEALVSLVCGQGRPRFLFDPGRRHSHGCHDTRAPTTNPLGARAANPKAPPTAGVEIRWTRPAKATSSRMMRRCSLPSWTQRAPHPSHHALGHGLTTIRTWKDSQTGHFGMATS